jgi:hypothetical protein
MSSDLDLDPISLLYPNPDPYYFSNIKKISKKLNIFIKFNDFLLILHHYFFNGHKKVHVGRIRSRTLINFFASRIRILNSELRISGLGSARNIFESTQLW